ncbi:MAG TPA: DNA-processing protein DprA [Stenomitos sp.]
MNERSYAAGFLGIEGVGSIRLRRLRERFGSLADAWLAPASELHQVHGIGAEIAQAIVAQRPEVDPGHELDRLAAAGVGLVCHWEAAFPSHLNEIADPPAVLFVRGRMPTFERAVAIVGTRGSTVYGNRIARAIARDLAEAGVVVVSGLARGIDTIAHQGALEKGTTVAVLGSSLDRVYPLQNVRLSEQIAETGAVLSEYPLGTEPAPGQFPARNRIVSGLCQAVVVVEARERSGALITADMALDQNREVMAVPGPADAPQSRGPHRLIQQGARLVTSAADIMDELGWSGPNAKREAGPAPVMADDEARVYAAIEVEPTTLDQIGLKSGLSPQVINSILLMLELRALVTQLPGRLYLRR